MSTWNLGDPEERFRPRIGRRRSNPDSVPPLGGGFRRLARKAARPARVAVHTPRESSRRCVIKSRYATLGKQGLAGMRRHLAYLERDGVERDGSPGRLYGADDGFDRDAFRAPLAGEERQFRFIVSPEDGDELDLKEFARRLMTQVEKDLGRRLIWAAVNHHNTDNPHVHIDVRGVDVDGDDVRIDSAYIKHQMRWRAQEIVTRELGPRTELEYSLAREAEIGAERFTMVDRFLSEHVQPDGTVTLKKLLARPGPEGRNCVARLQTLTDFKLAVEERPGVWRLTGGWKESLTRLGEQNDRIERLYPIVGEKAAEYQFLDPKLPVSKFGAVVVVKGLHDELSGQMFVAVQATHGQGYYIPLRPDDAESLHRGDTIRVGFKAEAWLKPADKAIAQVAKENGGVYAPVEHQRQLETKQATKSDADALSPANLVAGNIRRLERLVAYGLASQLPDGRWRVPSDLIAQLESRERTHSRSRLQIDKFPPAQREPAAPPITDLEKERVTIGEGAARRLGLTFVANPQRFRGQLVPAPAGPSGTEYVQVVDYRHRQLALVPKPKDAERLRGKVVTVARDPAGRLSIQISPEISR
jgi:type IV secretory pathway VirD2 relaxase